MLYRIRIIGLYSILLLAAHLALVSMPSGNWLITGPDNDNLSHATSISGLIGTYWGSNVNASKESWEGNHANNQGGASIWFSWVAPSSGLMEFNTIGSNIDTIMAIYSMPSDYLHLKPIAANDDGLGNAGRCSQITFSATQGVRYFIAVDGYSRANAPAVTGTIVLNWKASGLISSSGASPTPEPGVMAQLRYVNVYYCYDYSPSCYFLTGKLETGKENAALTNLKKPVLLCVGFVGFNTGRVDLKLVGPNNRIYLLDRALAENDWCYIIPLDYPIGAYHLMAKQKNLSATFIFKLKEATHPRMIVDTEIHTGRPFNVYLAGFAANSQIPIYIYDEAQCLSLTTGATDTSGVCYDYITSYKVSTDAYGRGMYGLIIAPDLSSKSYEIHTTDPTNPISGTIHVRFYVVQ
jgi:hypothetical protein